MTPAPRDEAREAGAFAVRKAIDDVALASWNFGVSCAATMNGTLSESYRKARDEAIEALLATLRAHVERDAQAARGAAVEECALECDIHAHGYEKQRDRDETPVMQMVHGMQATACKIDASSIRALDARGGGGKCGA